MNILDEYYKYQEEKLTKEKDDIVKVADDITRHCVENGICEFHSNHSNYIILKENQHNILSDLKSKGLTIEKCSRKFFYQEGSPFDYINNVIIVRINELDFLKGKYMKKFKITSL